MRRICLTVSKYAIGILVVSALVCFTVRAQQPTSEPVGAKANSAAKTDNPDVAQPAAPDPFDTACASAPDH